MNTELRDTINAVFCEVLENFAFSFATIVSPDMADSPEDGMLCASMEFNGPSGGRLTLLAPQSLCRTVAANAMGVDSEDEVSIETTMDTVKELLNITCGNLLTATWGTAPVFDLTSPRVEAVSPDESQCIAQDPESCHFLVDDDYTVILRLTPTEHPAGSPSVSAS